MRTMVLASVFSLAAAGNASATLLPLYQGLSTGEQTGTHFENGYTINLVTFNGTGVFVAADNPGPGNELEPRFPNGGGKVIVTETGGALFTFDNISVDTDYGSNPTLTVQGFLGGVLQGTDTITSTTAWPALQSKPSVNLAGIAIDSLEITGQHDSTAGIGFANLNVTTLAPVPETSHVLLAALAAIGVAGLMRRRLAAA